MFSRAETSGLVEQGIRLLGGNPTDTLLLIRVFTREREARRLENAAEGIDLQSLQIIVAIPLFLMGLAVVAGTIRFRHEPALAATLIFSVYTLAFLVMALTDLVSGLLGDEELRVIASWPVGSHSILLARLVGPITNAFKLAALLALPACLCACFCVGTPLVTGLCLILILAAWALGLALMSAAVACLLLRSLGLERLRFAVVFLVICGITLMSLLLLLYKDIPLSDFGQLTFSAIPSYLPPTWLGALASFTTSDPKAPLIALGGLLSLSVIPFLGFRWTAQAYSQGLLHRQSRATRARGKFFVTLLCLGSRRPGDRVLANLVVAHGRSDWRFQAQALMGLAFSVFLLASSPMESGQSMFSDPFIHEGYLHPSMALMVALLVPPLFMVQLLSSSAEYKAAWLLRMGQVTPLEFREASRRMQRIVYVAPVMISLTLVYLGHGVAPLHVLAHMLMLFLLIESMIGIVQSFFGDYPMSLPNQDEELALKLMPLFLLLEILGGLYSAFIYNVLYRWWWAYGLGVVGLVLVRRMLIHLSLHGETAKLAAPTLALAVAPKPKTTPLILAVKEGRIATVRLLLRSPKSDRNLRDEHGKTAEDWARESGDETLINLFQNE